MKVLYTAAHAGAAPTVPIGGGGAICRLLREEWGRTQPFELEVIGPEDTSAEDLVGMNEGDYAGFCHRFRHYATNRILSEDPAECVVLVNDISEGPDFAMLARHGYRIVTIWHVDVVAYVARMYLGGWIAAHVLTRLLKPWESRLPKIAQLVFKQQRECVAHSAAHVVMTEAMRNTIRACYPKESANKDIRVIPWGAPPKSGEGVRHPSHGPVLMTMSRISPEKGIERFLDALIQWFELEAMAMDESFRVPFFTKVNICGGPAFMQGEKYLTELREKAKKVSIAEVEFVGHLSGQAKLDAFASADIFVFPSRFESYGLTLMEALSHGLPVVCFESEGAKAIVEPSFGLIAKNPSHLAEILNLLTQSEELRQSMGAAARAYAEARPFSKAAAELASLLVATAR
jgi:glycosyltransferase involved in cell wall biosynthesis